MNNRIITALIAVLALITSLSNPCSAQCKEFNDNEAMPLLYDNENDEQYMLSGRYNTVKLAEGDDMLVFKSLNKDLKYRFIVKGDQNLPNNINFVIESWDGDIIYDNKDHDFEAVFTFQSKKAQRVKIYITVPKTGSGTEQSGCLSFITGLLND